MGFYDLHIEANDKDVIKMAKQLGFDGIAVVNPEIKSDEIEIISCAMIKVNSKEELNNEIEKYRNKVELIMVYGGNYEINKAACEDNRVDILCHPELGRNDSGLDHVCVKSAMENNVAIEINFNSVLNSKNRPRMLSYLRRNISLCKEYNAKIITVSGAKSKWEMRAPRELASLSHLLGLDINSAVASLSIIPENIIKINREKLSGKRIGDVKIVE
ncbi:MAG: RNase P subunit p30 family protein [Candidatus Aenigmatarchaeota archaeon]